ncbi:MAG: PAS domain S-box protein [Deltaproteobacteria bacterium]|nr:PAS domain S-box protein [Candidatus Zymogenaceae bacterium]
MKDTGREKKPKRKKSPDSLESADLNVAGSGPPGPGDIGAEIGSLINPQSKTSFSDIERRYRYLVEHLNEAIFSLDRDGIVTYLSPAVERISNLHVEELIDSPFDRFVHPEDTYIVHEHFSVAVSGRPSFLDFRIIDNNGDVRHIHASITPDIQNGEVVGVLGVFSDITVEKESQEALKENEERWRSLFENSIEGVFTVDLEGNLTALNDAFVELIGVSREESIGANFRDFMDAEEAGAVYRAYKNLYTTGEPIRNLTYTIRRNDGEVRKLESYVNTIRRGDRIIGFQGTIRDATERINAQTALAEEKEWLTVTLRSIGDGVITTDMKGRIVLLNRVSEELTGWTQEEACGKPLTEVFTILDKNTRLPQRNPVERVLEKSLSTELEQETILVSRDGTERVIADSAAPIKDADSNTIGVVLVFRDVTEKLLMEEELLKAQKLESIGTLAGGIAHDYNNLLTAILANISLMKLYVDESTKLYQRIAKAERATLNARDLTLQLLTFSRGGAPLKKPVLIEHVVRDAVDLALRGTKTRSVFKFPEKLDPVFADEGQVGQAVNNITVNADQAMPDGGTVTISGKNRVVTPDDVLPLEPGEYVHISIRDEGTGIDSEDLSKIFDPYFSNKQGHSGLGLSIAYSIVKNHDGHISVDSESGGGTTLSIYLPTAAEQPLTEVPEYYGPIGGKGRILVMDDEEYVRDASSQMLIGLGYKAVTARDGREAISLYEEAAAAGTPFDIVIMDLTVKGGMGGKEAARLLLKKDPDARIVVSSGYSNDPIMSEYDSYGFCNVIAKPYRIDDLGRKLKEILAPTEDDS